MIASPTIRISSYLTLLLLFATTFATTLVAHAKSVHIVASETNDLYQHIKKTHPSSQRYDDAQKALARCKKGDVILLLASDYPAKKTPIPKGLYRDAKAKHLKVFVEFPERVSDGPTLAIKSTKKERGVVTSSFFGKSLPEMTILDAGLYSYVTLSKDCPSSYLRGAKVAGFRDAVYGLKNTPSAPILFDDNGILVCTTKLSNYNKSRYSPLQAWGRVIGQVLSELSLAKNDAVVRWIPLTRPTFAHNETLPANARREAVRRGADWYRKGPFLIHPKWKKHWLKYGGNGSFPVGPPIDPSWPCGDGTLGVMEGHYSYINPDGSQQYRYWLRADCVAEVAMTLAVAGAYDNQKKNNQTAENLMNFLYQTDTFNTASSKNPAKGSYGLIGWANTHKDVYYGDDNARVLIASIMAAQLTGKDTWDDQITRAIIANFRTTGVTGFRKGSLLGRKIDAQTWQKLSQGTIINPHPHFESWLWATYLWLYDKTKQPELLEKAKRGITTTMEKYPNWKWTNGIQQERARMILPLAWLVRVDDTKQHRAWLDQIVTELLKNQMPSGAIREELGGAGGSYGPTPSNKKYGTAESPVIYKNGDPVADMLYTSNFAFFALNEAAHATNNPVYKKATNRLADFLVRIQSTSDSRADLDGCWFRAFDYNTWEYYGSNSDHGWGAWGTLTGWTQSFITTTLALNMEKTSFWSRTQNSTVARNADRIWKEMLPPTPALSIPHAAVKKKITLKNPPSSQYPGLGAAGLINGRGALDTVGHTHPEWTGFLGADVIATIDLGKQTDIKQIKTRFLLNERLGIHLPAKVEFFLSRDGKTFVSAGTVTPPRDPKQGKAIELNSRQLETTTRYIRVHAVNSSGTSPKKKKTWLFIDEIAVTQLIH